MSYCSGLGVQVVGFVAQVARSKVYFQELWESCKSGKRDDEPRGGSRELSDILVDSR